MKNLIKTVGVIAMVAVIGFIMITCDNGSDGGEGINEPVLFSITMTENEGWNGSGHDDWQRWNYDYQDEDKSFDLSGALTGNKVYVFTYSFSSDQDIRNFAVYFFNDNGSDWKDISNWTDVNVPGPIPKNTKYSGRIPLFPNGNASGCNPEHTYLKIIVKDRDVATPATLSFYKFSLEQVSKETPGLETWTIADDKQIKITDKNRTFAEIKTDYAGKSNVLHIKPTYSASTYDHFIMQYDLSAYAGKKIGIEMSVDAYLTKSARVAWQINSREPYYPVVCGNSESYFFLAANTWHSITGSNIITVPNDAGNAGKLLYLSGMQSNGAETYFANARITIDTDPDSSKKPSVEDFSDDEPEMLPNPYRKTLRKGGSIQIGIPSSLPGSGPATFTSLDTLIASITSQNGTSCTIQGLGVGTARITITVGTQTVTLFISVSPDEDSYKLPETGPTAPKRLGDYNTWDNGSGNRPDTLPSNYTDYIAEPTTQLAWYWQNTTGGIDFLAYYVDPTNSNKRGWVRTTYSFGGWRYDLNDARGQMNNGVQTNGNIKLQLKPEFVYDKGVPYLQITHTLTNNGSSKVTNQKFGASADIMLFVNDHAPLTYLNYGALMTNATTTVSPSIKFRLVCQNVNGVDNVSTLWMGTYGSERTYVYVDKREDVSGVDSAMNFSYRNIDLDPHQSKTFVVRFTQIQ